MPITTAAGTKVSIGTTSPMTDATTYEADTWVAIANIQDVGEAGSEAEIVIGKYVDQTYARKLKGSRDNGTMELVVARDSSDAGYAALVAAEQSSAAYNFQVELNDKPATGASPKNSKFYFSAIVASRKNSFKGADDIVNTTFSLAISGAILEVAASAT
ncbi:hypothetical protein HGP14_14705 [Rhizobium sp. P32RR-XVIII]|uniref:phage tail tube protein n=1 Tax=Rhizobium sp. P32RR-XVIII TaxID=2726738 RepID=UPI0014576EF6|nr:phage tail tube protein [Rhizobium sp. P32RR-XVIII]NLS04606.1 hypothetical protein [Rhizobium sp. P32RR-XVIII]